MGKNDAVDRMMSLATEKVPPSRKAASPGNEAGAGTAQAGAGTAIDARAVLEARVVASEPAVPAAARERLPVEKSLHQKEAITETPTETSLGRPRVPPGERGRQLLGALRPFLPAVGGALRMIDHGAAQAAARLLPLLGSVGPAAPAGPSVSPLAGHVESRPGEPSALAELLTTLDKRQSGMAETLKAAGLRIDTHDEQIRRVRETAERAVVEQGSLSHRVSQLTDRSRLLTAAVLVLIMLVIVQMVLLFLYLHR